MEKNKIGLALITCDRLNFFEKSFKSAYSSISEFKNSEFIVINDGKEKIQKDNCNIVSTKGNEGVGKSKNIGLKYLIEKECEHIFLMEDDIEIIDSKVFELYINACEKTGIKHFNYALHGNHNLDYNRKPILRKTINYTDGIKVDLYPNVLGAFSYYHIDTLKKCGVMDESFYNALEHVDHTYHIIKEGYHPPFRWFADVHNSKNYLKDIVEDHKESKIRSEEDYHNNFLKNLNIFIEKNKFSVVNNYGPQEKFYNIQEVLDSLKEIHKNHAKK
jgi:hypothetical protein